MYVRTTLMSLLAWSLLHPQLASPADKVTPAQRTIRMQPELERVLGMRFHQFRNPSLTASTPLILVTTTNDTGPGSLRQALLDANSHPGPDSIAFNLPKSDPGYNALKGVWTIKPLSQLPLITDDGTIIDGESQALFSPGSNPYGPAVQLDGSLAGQLDCGFSIICSWTLVRQIAVNRFSEMGIIIAGPGHSFNLIYRCYIGVTADGKGKAPNLKSGIQILDANLNFISWPDTTFANVIGGNGESGIDIIGPGSSLNYIGPNCIGTDLSHTLDLGNQGDGVSISSGAADNAITGFDFPNHIVVWNNGGAGIRVTGAGTVRNLLAAGSITRNNGPGIVLENGGNGSMPAPVITNVTDAEIRASAVPFSMVLFFRDQEDEGEEFLGLAFADPSGSAIYTGPVHGPEITAIAVDTTAGPTLNNTSAFSAPLRFVSWIEVTNTNDSGPGSLREAINRANGHPGPDSIRFAIPTTDPGYNAQLGTWTIRPLSMLDYLIDPGTVIDGYSQNGSMGYDVNPLGPEIELDGSLVGNHSALSVDARGNGAKIYGLIINRFGWAAIFLDGVEEMLVAGCYIGTDARGLQSAPNGTGILAVHNSSKITLGINHPHLGNLISGNTGSGIELWDTCNTIGIVGNTIGLDQSRSRKLGNGGAGIRIDRGCAGILMSANWVGGNAYGIAIDGSYGFTIEGNLIGTDTACRTDLGNQVCGLFIEESRNIVVRANRIAFNGSRGVWVDGPSAVLNRITRNGICHHPDLGISNTDGGNEEYACPVITGLSGGGVLTGTAQPYDLVEVFADSLDEGELFIEETQADAAGSWQMTLTSPPARRFLTATATDGRGNTSCFSAPFDYVAADVPGERDVIPETFVLEQNYPNPFNPRTVFGSQLPAASDVRLVIYDLLGREVAVVVNERRPAGYYEDPFDGSGLASGVYVYRMTAGSFVQSRNMVLVK